MKDRIAVVWTRLGPQPSKMGTLTVTEREARFTYEPAYSQSGLRGLGLVYPADRFDSTIIRPRSEYFDLFPPLQALIPPRAERNFQRALLLQYLNSIHVSPAPGFATDWEMLTHAGHGAIGHLDVFSDDQAALQWYASPSKKGLVELDGKFGFSLKEFMTWFDGDAEALIELLGPTPSVGGAIPKIPLSISRSGWDGRIGLPTRYGDSGRTDIILKLENNHQYPGITELEALALQLHQQAGFEVPRFWPVEVNGLRALAIERFDRNHNGGTVFMESIYSILASGSKHISHHYSARYDHIAQALDNPRLQIVSQRKAAKQHLLERLIMAMLTGNGDLHLENLAIIERNGELQFSPVYDPTPMRAYRLHDMLFPPGMSFGNYGEMPDNRTGEQPEDFKQAMQRFIKNLGISRNDYLNSLERLLKASADYPQQIQALNTLPTDNKNQLIAIHQKTRRLFEAG
ncbi:MAG TPA: HipA domain-containing protein [Gammaproteobacteria bacterium]